MHCGKRGTEYKDHDEDFMAFYRLVTRDNAVAKFAYETIKYIKF
jgi:hypothetical protein